MHTRTLSAAFIGAALLFPAHAASAAESYGNCAGFIDSVPAVITTQGVWCLRGDVSTAIISGSAISVETNNVTIECNDFKLGGLAAGTGTATIGIAVTGRLNTVVRNCHVRGFFDGVNLQGGGGHVIEDSRFDGNRWIAVRVNSDTTTVRGNLIFDTGGTTIYNSAYGIVLGSGNGNSAIDNSVLGVQPVGSNAQAYGILIGNPLDALIRSNWVSGLQPTGNGIAGGIYSESGNGVVVDSNVVHGPGGANSVGISCMNNAGTATRNVIRRFNTGIANCQIFDNVVNNN